MLLRAIASLPGNRRTATFVAALMLGQLALIGQIRSQDGGGLPPASEPPPAQLAPSDAPPAAPPPAPPPSAAPPSAAPPSAAPPSASPSSSSRPGLIDKLGDLLRDSAEGVSSTLKDTGQRIQDVNKGTVDALSSIPIAGLASGRALCPRSANGAPDCYAATEKLCKDKGYSAGRSLDTESAETCNPRIYLPGYQRKEGDCKLETFVTRAACQ